MMIRPFLSLILAVMAGAPAWAAPAIYRCGDDGRTYSQVPCPEGSLIEASDPRSAAQRAEARRMAEAERQRAAQQDTERKAAAKQGDAPRVASTVPKAPASKPTAPLATAGATAGATMLTSR